MNYDDKYIKVLKAALQEGFKLEFDTYTVINKFLKEYGIEPIEIGVNRPVNNYESEYTDTDVYVNYYNCDNNSFYHYLIECKGSKSTNKLVLIEQVNSFYIAQQEYPFYRLNGDGDIEMMNTGFVINGTEGPKIVFSGDFFQENKGNYSKTKGSYDKCHLHKGITQLNQATRALKRNTDLHHDTKKRSNIVMPLIVTNVELYVVNYDNHKISTVPWAIFQNKCHFEATPDINPYVFITNLENLSNFLDSYDYNYGSFNINEKCICDLEV